jgi:hypothetical protein
MIHMHCLLSQVRGASHTDLVKFMTFSSFPGKKLAKAVLREMLNFIPSQKTSSWHKHFVGSRCIVRLFFCNCHLESCFGYFDVKFLVNIFYDGLNSLKFDFIICYLLFFFSRCWIKED